MPVLTLGFLPLLVLTPGLCATNRAQIGDNPGVEADKQVLTRFYWVVDTIRPMLATLGELPPTRDQNKYAYEVKWDGVRLISYIEGWRVRCFSRNDRDVTVSYPELAELGDLLSGPRCVLDGEVMAFDANGRASFGVLQQRMHVTDAAQVKRLMTEVPVVYAVFDLLVLDGRRQLNRPYEERRTILFELGLAAPHIQVPPNIEGNGQHALNVSKEMSAEGIIAKRLGSIYRPGQRSPDWIKVKHIYTQEVVIGGWKPGAGRRTSSIGSLLIGVPEPDGLRYVGHVGTGFTGAMLEQLVHLLTPLRTPVSPFIQPMPRDHARDALWVRPEHVGEVAYSEWTSDGILRHPSWRGLRPDKRPDDVRREELFSWVRWW